MGAEEPAGRLCTGRGVCRQGLPVCYISSCGQAALCLKIRGFSVWSIPFRVWRAERKRRKQWTQKQEDGLFWFRHVGNKFLSPSIGQHRHTQPWIQLFHSPYSPQEHFIYIYIYAEMPMPMLSQKSASHCTNKAPFPWAIPVLSLPAWIPAPKEETCKSSPASTDGFCSLQTPVSQQEISAEWAALLTFKSFEE